MNYLCVCHGRQIVHGLDVFPGYHDESSESEPDDEELRQEHDEDKGDLTQKIACNNGDAF